jgi:hypothetical protein
MKPRLPWSDDTGDGLYFRTAVGGCVLFAHPHEWMVYYGSVEVRGPLGTRAGKDESMCAAEAAARELLKEQKARMDLLFLEQEG